MSSLINTFSPRHMPALFIAFTQAVGGLWPILGNTPKAISEFGLPPRIARSPEAQTAFVAGAGRTTVIGVLVHVLYFQGKYEELDTVLTILVDTMGPSTSPTAADALSNASADEFALGYSRAANHRRDESESNGAPSAEVSSPAATPSVLEFSTEFSSEIIDPYTNAPVFPEFETVAEMIVDTETTIVDMKKKNQQLESEFSRKLKAFTNLKGQVASLSTKNKRLREEIKRINLKNRSQAARLGILQSKIPQQEASLKALDEANGQLGRDLLALRQEKETAIANLQNVVVNLEHEILLTQVEDEAKSNRIAFLEDQVRVLMMEKYNVGQDGLGAGKKRARY
ncbi:hypothetical protein OQA88_9320 [Cercophora sp. LCS_1]